MKKKQNINAVVGRGAYTGVTPSERPSVRVSNFVQMISPELLNNF